MKLTFKSGPSTGKKRTPEAEKKRKKSLTKTMEKRRREKNAWYCQSCSEKRYADKPKFVVCEKCYRRLAKLKEVGK